MCAFEISKKDTPLGDSVYLNRATVYIAGVKMPVFSVSITYYAYSPAAATVTMPPYRDLLFIGRRDKLPVQIFIKETQTPEGRWLLMFDGYLTQRTFQSSAGQRSVQFLAASWDTLLQDIQFSFMSGFDSLLNSKASFSNEQALNIMQFPFQKNAFAQILRQGLDPSSKESIDTPTQFLQNVYAYIANSGSKVALSAGPGSGKQAPFPEDLAQGLNSTAYAAFYAKLLTLLRFGRRYANVPYFDYDVGGTTAAGSAKEGKSPFPFLDCVQKESAMDVLTHEMDDAVGADGSAYGLLGQLAERMDYHFCVIGNPAYHARRHGNGAKPYPGEDGSELVATCMKPRLEFSTYAPMCNVIFRTQVNTLSYQDSLDRVPTRVRINDARNSAAIISPTASSAFNLFAAYKVFPCYGNEAKMSDSQELYDLIKGSEEFTGPVVKDISAPIWYSRGVKASTTQNDNDKSGLLGLQARYCRRELLYSIYNDTRTAAASCVFLPYATAGFPAVVFDTADMNYSMAGLVSTVTHTITSRGAETSITLTCARPLAEASCLEIPEAEKTIEDVTHSKDPMDKVYGALLGDPDSSSWKGAEAAGFADLYQAWSGESQDPVSPQNNPSQAYAAQRRNIANFEQYCELMGLSVELEDPHGLPFLISGEFVTNRADVIEYVPGSKMVRDPQVEEIRDGKGADTSAMRAAGAYSRTFPASSVSPAAQAAVASTNFMENPTALAMKHESGSNSSAVGCDWKISSATGRYSGGGTSCGRYQLSSVAGTLKDFCRYARANGGANGAHIADTIEAAAAANMADTALCAKQYGVAEYNGFNDGTSGGRVAQAWKKLASEGCFDGGIEAEYMMGSNGFGGCMRLINDSEIKKRIEASPTLQNVVFATVTEQGYPKAAKIINKYWSSDMSSEELLDATYASGARLYSSSNAWAEQHNTKRLPAEYKDAKAMLVSEIEAKKASASSSQEGTSAQAGQAADASVDATPGISVTPVQAKAQEPDEVLGEAYDIGVPKLDPSAPQRSVRSVLRSIAEREFARAVYR